MRRPGRLKNREWWGKQLAGAPGWLMAAIPIGLSAMMTVTCGYRMGAASGFGLLGAAGALFIELYVDLAIPKFWRHVGILLRAAMLVIFAGLLLYKLEAGRRFAAEIFGTYDAAVTKTSEAADIATERINSLRKKIADNADARAVTVIQNEIDTQLRKPGTDGCPAGVAWNGPVTKVVCPKVDTLRGELARAKIRDQAEIDLVPALEEWRKATPSGGKVVQETQGIPQLLLALIGISVPSWSALASLFMLGIEGGAILLPILVERASRETRRPAVVGEALVDTPAKRPPQSEPAPGETQVSPASPEVSPTLSPRAQRDRDELAAFLDEKSERAAGERVQASKLYAVYFQWKTERGETPMKVQPFGALLGAQLGLTKRKISGKNWYLDVRLRHPAQGRKAGKHLHAVAA
jgi:hypothetical protein